MDVPRPELALAELTATDLPFLFELWHKPGLMHYADLRALCRATTPAQSGSRFAVREGGVRAVQGGSSWRNHRLMALARQRCEELYDP